MTDSSDIVHLSGAISVAPGEPAREVLQALGGRLTVMVGAGDGAGDAPYAVISHRGSGTVPCVCNPAPHDVSAIAPDGTRLALPGGSATPSSLQIQLGPLAPDALGEDPGPAVEVVTLAVSAEREASGSVTFIAQAIGGWLG